MTWFFVMIFGMIGFAGFIDWRRKRNNNTALKSINSHAKPGESSNYSAGASDNSYSGGQ